MAKVCRDSALPVIADESCHTADDVAGEWNRPYSREQAVFPVTGLREHKYWPPVNRIDNVHGDRNPVCTCEGMDAYAE